MKSFVIAIIATAFFASVVPAYAATGSASASSYHYQRLFYYTNSALSKAAFLAHASSIDVIAPQNYKIASDGTISGTVDPDILAAAKKYGVKVMPLVTNGGFSKTASQAFLGDSTKETTAINALIADARDHGYWGYQFDFEQMDASEEASYTAFIQRAATAFHAHGLKISVAVIAKISDNPSDYGSGLWQNLIGVYDYSALAAATDFVSVMSYDDPTSKQGAAPMPWYKQVVAYAAKHIPANKLSLGIPDYYWQWQNSTSKVVGIGGTVGVTNVFTKYSKGLTMTYDSTAQEPVIHYTGMGGIKYTLWYENEQSVAAKIAIAKTNRFYGVSIWKIGLELPTVYADLKE